MNSGDSISRAVIGTWPLSGDFGRISLSKVERILQFCVENNFYEFDVAPNYGSGFMEFALGNVLGGNSKILINTKVGNIPFYGKSFDFENIKKYL